MLLPTTISWVPNRNGWPEVMCTPLRSSSPCGDTPRTDTFASELLPIRRRSITTMSSLERSDRPSAAGATSGCSSNRPAVSRSIWLTSSELAERRSTITLSGAPVSTRVACNPRASISTPANTNTTSATPPTVRSVVNRRAHRLRHTYENGMLIMAGSSDHAQAVDDRRPDHAHGGQGPGHERGKDSRPERQRDREGLDADHGEEAWEREPEAVHDWEGERQPDHTADQANQQGLTDDENGDVAALEPQGLQHGVLSRALARGHHDRVRQHQQNDAHDHERDHLERRDDSGGHRHEPLLEFALALGLGGCPRVREIAVHGRGHGCHGTRRIDLQDEKPGVHGPARLALLHLLVQVLPVEEHLRFVHRRIAAGVDPPHHKLPRPGVDVAFHRDHVAQFEAVLPRQLATDDAGVALLLKCVQLVRRDLKLGIEGEVRARVDREAGPEVLEVVRVSVHAPEPVRPRHAHD